MQGSADAASTSADGSLSSGNIVVGIQLVIACQLQYFMMAALPALNTLAGLQQTVIGGPKVDPVAWRAPTNASGFTDFDRHSHKASD
eukprot:SAG31_NODE_21110_length_557_cov_2.187773_2_plen_86_part_01